nr:RNA methyltransferase [Ramlibacter albus]
MLKDLRKLAQDSTAYRKQGRVWLEGDHLCRAAIERGVKPAIAVFQESAWPQYAGEFGTVADKTVLLAENLFASLSSLDSPAKMGFIVKMPEQALLKKGVPTVVLDGLQDTGNVGSILRSAAAFGFRQILAIKGTAALWSPKVLRAGMGAHFALDLLEGMEPPDAQALDVPIVVTSSHEGELLHETKLPWPCAWVLGHEGQGVSTAMMEIADRKMRIAQPGGEESLNVAAAAAICLHASAAAGVAKAG